MTPELIFTIVNIIAGGSWLVLAALPGAMVRDLCHWDGGAGAARRRSTS